MGMFTDVSENKLIDFLLRAQSITVDAKTGSWSAAPNWYVGIITASKGTWLASTAYSLGDTVLPVTPNGRLYKCTTAGTSAGTTPTFPTSDGGTVTDGGVLVWTEQSLVIEAGVMSSIVEPVANGYARVTLLSALTAWAGTQSAGSTTASSGTSGTSSNNAAITFPTPTGTGWGTAFGTVLCDALTGGSAWLKGVLTTPQVVAAGNTVSYAAGQLSIQLDNT